MGQVTQAQGDWAQAEQVYRESLSLRRQLVERLGGTPEALDDLASGLVQIASLPGADAAEKVEALAIYEKLVAQFPDVARYRERWQQLTSANAAIVEHAASADRGGA